MIFAIRRSARMFHWPVVGINNEIQATLEMNNGRNQLWEFASYDFDNWWWNFSKNIHIDVPKAYGKGERNYSTYQKSQGPGAEGSGAGLLIFKGLLHFLKRPNWQKCRSGRRYISVFVWLFEYNRLPCRL